MIKSFVILYEQGVFARLYINLLYINIIGTLYMVLRTYQAFNTLSLSKQTVLYIFKRTYYILCVHTIIHYLLCIARIDHYYPLYHQFISITTCCISSIVITICSFILYIEHIGLINVVTTAMVICSIRVS